MKTDVMNIKKKVYVIECLQDNKWWSIGDFDSKSIAIDTMKFKKKEQKSLKWRTLERVTIVKEKKVA